MNWTHAGLYAVTAIYAAQAGVYAVQQNWAQVAILGGYVIANLGLIWSFN